MRVALEHAVEVVGEVVLATLHVRFRLFSHLRRPLVQLALVAYVRVEDAKSSEIFGAVDGLPCHLQRVHVDLFY